ncbi:MAG: RagB/SusD family nutrient uptake outer membrane protein [Bacteroidales bacterium]
MKKIFLSIFVLLSSLTSCNDLLKEDPQFTINGKTLFQRESDAQLALNGCYGYLTTWDAYGQAFWEVQEGSSGLYWSQTNNQFSDELVSMNIPSSNLLVSMSWKGFYITIANCNLFLSNLQDSPLSEEYKLYAGSQAKFIRALCYYNLVFTYGDVPLRLEPSSPANLNMARTPKNEVISQIEKDWKDALMGLKNTEDNSSLPTIHTVNAYMAKLYWMMGSQENTSSSKYWAMAKEYGDKVIDVFQLENNVATIFNRDTKDSKESIFKLNTSVVSVKDDQGNRTNWLFSPQNSTTGISWGRYRISKAFHDDFRGTYPTDPRLDVTMMSSWKDKSNLNKYAYPFYIVKSGREEILYSVVDYENTSLNPRNPDPAVLDEKVRNVFMNSGGDHQGWAYLAKTYDAKAEAQRSYKHFYLYRYADLLLLMADVENELGNKAKSLEYINKVLSRARNSVTPAAKHPQDISNSITQEELRVQIFNERQFELMGECFTFMDVRRRGEDFFKEHILKRYNSHLITQGHAPVQANANFWDRLLPENNSKKNLLMPIPQDELNANSQISSADQNFGY